MMSFALAPWTKLHNFYQRKSASLVFKRPFAINGKAPLISFTFDDFPRSALFTGGAILNRHGLAGTYYVSLGLAGTETPTGTMFVHDDLRSAIEQGHELGCHTFAHCHSWKTDPASFEQAVVDNQRALTELLPEAKFTTFSYPISPPRPRSKARIAPHFLCCRGSGQRFNSGIADLNQLSAFFLEQSRDSLPAVKDMIDRNARARGWLIFATHDVDDKPTRYGCTPEFFAAVVEYAIISGATILPVTSAVRELMQQQGHELHAKSGRLPNITPRLDGKPTEPSEPQLPEHAFQNTPSRTHG
jgi:peptidoglycan/xylan/chitin deacetylase (PgdA/CDA1 family)